MNITADDPMVGLDTQCFSYLLDALAGVAEPTDVLADERKSLIRSWFYMPGSFYVPQTVVTECEEIQRAEWRELHLSFVMSLFDTRPLQHSGVAALRTVELMQLHPKMNDCRIFAEAEDMGLKHLLSYDRRFLRRLGQASSGLRLQTPSSYWKGLAIPRGAQPRTVPHESNPLSQETWWRW